MNYNYSMDKDKAKLINQDAAKAAEEDVTASSDPTIESKKYDKDKTVGDKGDSTSGDKTISLFDKTDIQQKLQDDLDEVPEIRPEDMQSGYLSKLISKPFFHKTEEERLKINRNFLRDAEPLTLERLKEDIDSAREELSTGFPSLDHSISIPNQKFTLIASRPQHGKTVFMLNMLLNMCQKYPQRHFLYYSYGDPKQDIETKLINMSGVIPFSPLETEGIATNFKRWQYELTNRDIHTLKDNAENDPEYKGLKNFLEISSRVHIIDANYNIIDLLDSIRAFNNTLSVGTVFIDYLQAIRPDKTQLTLPRHQQVQGIANQLIDMGNETRFLLILGAQLARGEKNTPEYDGLTLDHLQDLKDAEQVAGLIIGLQNYAASTFIGSNINDQFKSRFYQDTFKRAEKMPESFKDKHTNSVILAKVLVNRGGPLLEVELLFNKRLMKISETEKENLSGEKGKKVDQ
jgi:replicative DNA helicase